MKRIITILSLTALAVSCGTISKATRGTQYAKMYEEKPVTILVMPPINNTTNVEAKEYLYTSITRPLAEAGYYVISPLLGLDILKAESAYDAELFAEGSLAPFEKFFGCDAVVFCEINDWTKRGFGIDTKLRYFIRSAHSGEIIFDRTCRLRLDLSSNTSFGGNNSALSVLVNLAASAIKTATTDHVEAGRLANYYIFRDIPRGKYNEMYLKDQDVTADPKDIETTVKQ